MHRQNNAADTPRAGQRQDHSDQHHDQPLLRGVEAINEQTARSLGPLPLGGSPLQSKRKPGPAEPARPTQEFRS